MINKNFYRDTTNLRNSDYNFIFKRISTCLQKILPKISEKDLLIFTEMRARLKLKKPPQIFPATV